MEIWRRITQDKLSATRGSSNQFPIHRDEVPALKVLAQQRLVTETRSVTLATAARSLGIQNRTARELLDSGDLVEDHNPTGNGWISVTKESVAAVGEYRQRRMKRRPLDISGFIDIQIAVERTGRTRKRTATDGPCRRPATSRREQQDLPTRSRVERTRRLRRVIDNAGRCTAEKLRRSPPHRCR
jgi:hypothetical protein